MKIITILASVAVVGVAAVSVAMAKTNPTQAEYEEYAVKELSQYIKKDVCKKAPSFLENLLQNNCVKLVDNNRQQMREIIANHTERHDFVVFSFYRTEFKVSSFIPSYKVETVGVWDKFYTYSAKQE